MKRLFYFFALVAVSFATISCEKDEPRGRGGHGDNPTPTPTPSNDVYQFQATDSWAKYYGDIFDNGTGVYMLQLWNGNVDEDGLLQSAGDNLMLLLSANVLEGDEEVTLQVGDYKTGKKDNATFAIRNKLIEDSYYTWFQNWGQNKKEADSYYIDGGTVTIKKNGKNFDITANLDIFYYDNDMNEVDAGSIECTYRGPVSVEYETETDELYNPILEDVNMGKIKDAICYYYKLTNSLLGNYYITFIDCDTDDQGYVTSEGHLLTLDLYSDFTEDPDINMLNGTFVVAQDVEVFEEGTYQPGYIYLDDGNEANWWGSYLDEMVEYNDGGEIYYDYGRSGLITGGTVKSEVDGDKVKMTLDLTTEKGTTVKGVYEGELPIEVEDDNELPWVKARKAPVFSRTSTKPFMKGSKKTSKPMKLARGMKMKTKF